MIRRTMLPPLKAPTVGAVLLLISLFARCYDFRDTDQTEFDFSCSDTIKYYLKSTPSFKSFTLANCNGNTIPSKAGFALRGSGRIPRK